MNYSKGISWIDDCKIPFVDEKDPSGERYKYRRNTNNLIESGYGFNSTESKEYTSQGRFPANLLCSDDVLNDGVISKSSGNVINNTKPQTIYGNGKGIPRMKHENIPCDQGTNSRYYDIDKWFDKIIDELL